ncbi:MAG: hypothetical protein ACTHOD_04880 [Motilibacteraceae bacterium]
MQEWLVIALSPVLAFVGALTGAWLNRKGARELDEWRQREETMRIVRWAADKATGSEREQDIAAAALSNLITSELLKDPDLQFVQAIAGVMVESARDEYLDQQMVVAEPTVEEGDA